MKRFPSRQSRPPVRAVSLILALGLLGGGIVGAPQRASAQVVTDGIFAEGQSYYENKYAGYDGYSGESSYRGYGAEGVPEPSLLAGLFLAGAGLTYLRRYQLKQKA
ncbi:PEP-CTERM sorting domain-containing protein [Trichothermofontia sp.]